MRHPRIKFELGQDGLVHVYNRTAGCSGEFPFGNIEKEEFLRRLKALDAYYAVDVVAAVVMGNHYHVILHVPAEPPGGEETAERYHGRYPKARRLKPDSRKCRRLALKLRDLSAFMHDLQQPFTRWFNRTRPRRRHGHLWAGRFRSTLLESGLAVWCCWKYIEMNPVRAHLAESPADYRFCSFGEWSATGKHPFARAFREHVMPSLCGLLQVDTPDEVKRALRREFVRLAAGDRGESGEQVGAAMATAAEQEPFSVRTDRRVRYWIDGLVIGSRQFVRETMIQARGEQALEKRRLVRAKTASGDPSPLCSFKQLRVLLQ